MFCCSLFCSDNSVNVLQDSRPVFQLSLANNRISLSSTLYSYIILVHYTTHLRSVYVPKTVFVWQKAPYCAVKKVHLSFNDSSILGIPKMILLKNIQRFIILGMPKNDLLLKLKCTFLTATLK